MKSVLRTLRHQVYFIIALAFVAAGFTPLLPLLTQSASAAEVTTRSIEMSSSVASATNVTYAVTFTLASSTTEQGVVLDICDNDPLVGDTTCTAPAGFSFTASPTVNNLSSG